jgi:Phosphoribosylglycinamide synthetase, N domain
MLPAFAAPTMVAQQLQRPCHDAAVARRRPVSCASPKPPKRKGNHPKPSSAPAPPMRLGATTASGSSRSNAGLMQAMGDYFGDDGRELDDYAKRPRNADGKVMLRVLLVGSGPAEVATAKELHASKRVRGLYYCPDEAGAREEAMEPLANTSTVGAIGMEREIVEFCRWACVDCVFVGPDKVGCLGQATEAELAADGITVFQHDVSAAVAAGTMNVDGCFATISEELDAVAPPAEQLVE